MKQIHIIILAILLVPVCAGVGSCTKFLEEDIRSNIPEKYYFNTEEDAVQFLYGIHTAVRNTVFGESFFLVTDCMTDDMLYRTSNTTYRNISSLRHDSRMNMFNTVWSNLYDVINNANILIDKVSELQEKIEFKSGNLIDAEARVLRAWAYLNLVQLWGDVPLTTEPTYSVKETDIYPKRASVNAVYGQIMADLNYAVEHLPVSSPGSIILGDDFRYPLILTQAVVHTLRARVNPINRQYQEVLTELQPLIDFSADGDIAAGTATDETPYGLIADYGTLFDKAVSIDDEPNRRREILWKVEASHESAVYNAWHRYSGPTANLNWLGETYSNEELPVPTSGATGAYVPTEELLTTYNPSQDKRYQWQYKIINMTPRSYVVSMKGYDRTAVDNNIAGNDAILLRFADVLLMHAEAANELNDYSKAASSLNRVRVRAGLDPIDIAELEDKQANLRDSIMLERRHEFALEGGYRLFDLRRTGRYYQTMVDFNATMDAMILAKTQRYSVPAFPHLIVSITIPWGPGNKYPQPHHVLHPIPYLERIANGNLTQNPGYIN